MNLLEMQAEKLNKESKGASSSKIEEYLGQLQGWEQITEGGEARIRKSYKFKNFRKALDFTNQVGEMAEEIDHHPMIVTEWGKVTLTWWTHVVGGLHKNDFIAAARSDKMFEEMG